MSAFSVHPFEAGDYIIQEVPVKRPRITEYALLHKLADGVYMVWPIDESDADEPTRAAYCGSPTGTACRIETREQLFAFARATAARNKQTAAGAARCRPRGEAARAARPPAHRPPPRRPPQPRRAGE